MLHPPAHGVAVPAVVALRVLAVFFTEVFFVFGVFVVDHLVAQPEAGAPGFPGAVRQSTGGVEQVAGGIFYAREICVRRGAGFARRPGQIVFVGVKTDEVDGEIRVRVVPHAPTKEVTAGVLDVVGKSHAAVEGVFVFEFRMLRDGIRHVGMIHGVRIIHEDEHVRRQTGGTPNRLLRHGHGQVQPLYVRLRGGNQPGSRCPQSEQEATENGKTRCATGMHDVILFDLVCCRFYGVVTRTPPFCKMRLTGALGGIQLPTPAFVNDIFRRRNKDDER